MAEEKEEIELKGELAELEAEFKEFDAEFGIEEEELEPEAFAAMTELEEEMELAGISEFGEGIGEEVSVASLGLEEPDVQAFFLGWIKRKVRRLIRRLISLARRYGGRCAPCVRMLVEAIRLYRRRKYSAALWQAYRAYRCFRRCIRR